MTGSSVWRQRRLMVLCYHGVSVADEHEWSGLYVSPAHLRRRLERLRALGCTLLPLGDAIERQAQGALPPKAVALTFDDGAADFHSQAYPILREFDAPVMLYQTTWYVDKPFPVFNTAASYLMWRARGRRAALPWRDARVIIPTTTDSSAFRALHSSLLEHVARHQLDAARQNELLRSIADACHESLDRVLALRLLHLMTADQLRDLSPSLVDVQLHTHRHRTPRDRARFVRELDDNASYLRRILRRDLALTHFCYPSGMYVEEFAGWLREWGMQSATTCDPGITSNDTDRLFIPRLIDTMQTPDVVFDAWVTGAAAFVPGRRRA